MNKRFRDLSNSLVVRGCVRVISLEIAGLFALNNDVTIPKISLINKVVHLEHRGMERNIVIGKGSQVMFPTWPREHPPRTMVHGSGSHLA